LKVGGKKRLQKQLARSGHDSQMPKNEDSNEREKGKNDEWTIQPLLKTSKG